MFSHVLVSFFADTQSNSFSGENPCLHIHIIESGVHFFISEIGKQKIVYLHLPIQEEQVMLIFFDMLDCCSCLFLNVL